MQEVAPEAIEAAQERAVNIKPPYEHKIIDSQETAGEAQKQWEQFSTRILRQSTEPPLSNLRYMARCARIRSLSPILDMRHVYHGRYNRKDPAATRESLYRKHVLEGETTHSAAFDSLFASWREHQLRYGPTIAVAMLMAVWEKSHPGEDFYPDVYKADLRKKPLASWGCHAQPWGGYGYAMARGMALLAGLQEPRKRNQRDT